MTGDFLLHFLFLLLSSKPIKSKLLSLLLLWLQLLPFYINMLIFALYMGSVSGTLFYMLLLFPYHFMTGNPQVQYPFSSRFKEERDCYYYLYCYFLSNRINSYCVFASILMMEDIDILFWIFSYHDMINLSIFHREYVVLFYFIWL